MKVKSLLQRMACVFSMIVVAGSLLIFPNQAVLAKPASAAFTGCAAQSEIPATECEALVALYNSANGARWADHSGWLETDTPCSWFGVFCGEGHVIQLVLEGNNLSGSLPPQLGSLTELEWLALNSNQLNGTIPAQLGDLTNLFFLFLDHNQLRGSIPPQLGNLVHLADIQLSYNNLSGPIPAELSSLTELTQLDLQFNRLKGEIPAELGNLTELHYLVLNDNNLSGPLPSEIGNIVGIWQLHLANNRLSGEIPASITNLVNLFDLTLSCGLTSTDPAVIAFIEALVPGWQDQICHQYQSH